jgi:hypothetical protein
MTNEIATRTAADLLPEAVEQVLVGGDLSKLTAAQRLAFYRARCEAAGLDPRGRPFEFLQLNGKLVLYARKECSEQLAGMHGITTEIVNRGHIEGGLYEVEVLASMRDGRKTTDIGIVVCQGLKGPDLANAIMKCITKAKRRSILSLCGLGDVLDESERDTLSDIRECDDKGQPKRLENNSGHATGQYCSEAEAESYLAATEPYLAKRCREWLDKMTLPDGSVWNGVSELCNRWQLENHLVKWAVETGRLDAASVPEGGIRNRLIGRLIGILWHRDKKTQNAVKVEMAKYFDRQELLQKEKVAALNPGETEADPAVADNDFEFNPEEAKA